MNKGTQMLLVGSLLLSPFVYASEVTIEKVAYAGWNNCIKLSNGTVELIATTDVGPRIIRYGFVGGQNLFLENNEDLGKTGGDEWRSYGGHRLWHAPEALPRTYWPDNVPVKHDWDGKTLKLTQPMEETTGVSKEIEVTLDRDDSHVTLVHRTINNNPWAIKLAPWCLTVMVPGGRAIVPHEEYRPHPDYVLPARPLVLWHYTDMSDPRFIWGAKYIQLRQDPSRAVKQKFGIMNTKGWAAYALSGDLFIKRFPYEPDRTYVDFGCNTELFTNESMLEVESLGPLTKLAADGGSVEHTEHWFLFKVVVGEDEKSIDAKVLPLIRKTDAYK